MIEHLALVLLRVPFLDVESANLTQLLVSLLLLFHPVELLHVVVQEADAGDLPREARVNDIILDTRSDPAQSSVPFVQEISQHIWSAFARVTSSEPEIHEGIDVVNCFSSYLVFAVVVDQPKYLQTVNPSFSVPLMFIF